MPTMRAAATSKPMHTPGPWAVEEPMGPQILSVVANGAAPAYDWVHVAQIGIDDPEEQHEGGIPRLQAEADARLIASAPDLLGALVAALPYIEAASRDPHYKGGAINKMVVKIRAAICRAEGK